VLFDLNPHQVLRIAGHRLPDRYASKLSRYRYGPGVFKIDFALNGPIPWRAAECSQASTVHLGGTFEEIAQAEADVWKGIHPERPYVLMGQPTPFDPTRAPEGKHVAWAYCHVPNGSTFDMSGRIERQIERFAPGFRDLILARHSMTASQMAIHNPNYVGGDIASGSNDLRQLIARPVMRLDPYSTPAKGVYICSSSTPPGAGVHGMCGHNAARSALRFLNRL
jgi:phytoene dehydrogenase-like protein